MKNIYAFYQSNEHCAVQLEVQNKFKIIFQIGEMIQVIQGVS